MLQRIFLIPVLYYINIKQIFRLHGTPVTVSIEEFHIFFFKYRYTSFCVQYTVLKWKLIIFKFNYLKGQSQEFLGACMILSYTGSLSTNV
jgi:hypothetical protein